MLVQQRPKAMVMIPRQKSRKQQGLARRSAATNPPQLSSNVVKNHTFRFLAADDFTGSITNSNIGGALGTICTVALTTCTLINESFKVKNVSMWSPPSMQGDATTVSINWIGSSFAPNKEYSDTSVSVSRPAQIHCKPPPLSSASFWQSAGSGTGLFNLVAPKGTVIDINLTIVEGDDEENFAATTVAAVLGNTYYLALDGPVTNLLVPVSLATTN